MQYQPSKRRKNDILSEMFDLIQKGMINNVIEMTFLEKLQQASMQTCDLP